MVATNKRKHRARYFLQSKFNPSHFACFSVVVLQSRMHYLDHEFICNSLWSCHFCAYSSLTPKLCKTFHTPHILVFHLKLNCHSIQNHNFSKQLCCGSCSFTEKRTLGYEVAVELKICICGHMSQIEF